MVTAPHHPLAQSLVLLVNHDDDTRHGYAEHLRLSGMDIVESADGREALATAIARPPDALVTDAQLPGLNGFELCQCLRRDPSTSLTAMIVLAERGEVGWPHEAERCADSLLLKPCAVDVLRVELHRLI